MMDVCKSDNILASDDLYPLICGDLVGYDVVKGRKNTRLKSSKHHSGSRTPVGNGSYHSEPLSGESVRKIVSFCSNLPPFLRLAPSASSPSLPSSTPSASSSLPSSIPSIPLLPPLHFSQIGRASCRERV